MLDKILGSVLGSPSFTTDSFLTGGQDNGYGQVTAGDGQYEFKSHQYPLTLGEKSDPHYMVFYINVDSQSKFLSKYTDLGNAPNKEQNSIGSGIVGSVLDKVGQVVGDVGSKIGSSIGSAVGGVFGGMLGGNFVSGLITDAIDDFKGSKFGSDMTGAVSGQFSKSTKRINRAIVLPIPTNLSSDYGIQWESGDLGMAAGIFADASKTQNQEAYKDMGKVVGTVLGRAGVRVGAAVVNNKAVQGVVGGPVLDAGNVVEKLTRSNINPRKEQLFKSVGFRQFQFQWVLTPKNQKESAAILAIIKEFKLHMHPELTPGGFFYVYPSEFDMKFYFAGVENTALAKVSTCVLTDLKVNYTPRSEFVTYKDGMPDSIQLSLSFTELELLTKERIAVGY